MSSPMPPTTLSGISDLLCARPDLLGIGISDAVQVVCA